MAFDNLLCFAVFSCKIGAKSLQEMRLTRFKTPGGKEKWQLVWYFKGETIRKRFKSKNAANEFIRKEKGLSNDVYAALRNASETEQADLTTALDLAREHGFSLTEAARAYRDSLLENHVTYASLQEAQDAFVERCRSHENREVTINRYQQAFRALRATHDKPPHTFTRADIERFLSNPDWAPSTRNWYYRHIRALFNWLIESDRISIDPFKGIKLVKIDEEAPAVFTVPETKKLLATAQKIDPGVIPYLSIGLFAGIRPKGLERLSWDNIDLSLKRIRVSGAANKTRDLYHATMQPNLVAWLRKVKGSEIVPTNFRKRLDAVKSKAGWGTPSEEYPKLRPWPVDVMRHSFASYHAARFKNAVKTAWELGHRGDPTMLFKHYQNLVKPEDAKKYFAIRPS